ncbi:hypothetical protein PC116_g30301 [Phytophthora cactorum]|nr:hypothetical protein PC116_g30301 [Phytophthora cactorum]
MGIVSFLMLVGNKILLIVMEELDLFQSFSIWLRHEIDRLAAPSAVEELSEKEATMEHGKVLAYIQQYMAASPLRNHLSNVSPENAERGRQKAESGSSLLELLSKQLNKQDTKQIDDDVFTQVEFLYGYLEGKASAIFEGIAEAEKRSVRFGEPTALELPSSILKFDVIMSALSNSVCPYLSHCSYNTNAHLQDTPQAPTYTALITESDKRRCMN